MSASSASHCCDLCKEVEYCNVFSWDGETCWLKQWAGTATGRNGYVSGHFKLKPSHYRENFAWDNDLMRDWDA